METFNLEYFSDSLTACNKDDILRAIDGQIMEDTAAGVVLGLSVLRSRLGRRGYETWLQQSKCFKRSRLSRPRLRCTQNAH